jgi:hypothetical protein
MANTRALAALASVSNNGHTAIWIRGGSAVPMAIGPGSVIR